MLSNPYKQTLTFKPQPSQQLLLWLIVLHSCAGLIILFVLVIPLLQQGLLLLIISGAGYFNYRLHYKKTAKAAIIAVSLNADNQWHIRLAQQTAMQTATLLDSSLLHNALMILNFKLETGKTYSVILPRDAIKPTLARQIRARIRVMSVTVPN